MAQGALAAVGIDVREIVRMRERMKLWATDQLPFATAAALTDTAKDATSYVREALSDTFTVRNRGFRNAVRYEPADKRDKPIEAVVGVAEWARFLVFHAIGGLKRAQAGHRVAVPTQRIKRTASGRVPARRKPRAVRAGGRLIRPLLDKRGLIAIRNKKGIEILYTLTAGAQIKPRWPFHEQVEETVQAKLGHHFLRRARQAFETAR